MPSASDRARTLGARSAIAARSGLDVAAAARAAIRSRVRRRGMHAGAAAATRRPSSIARSRKRAQAAVGMSSQRQRLGDLTGPARAVDEAVEANAHAVEQREVQVRQRRLLRIPDVIAALDAADAAARDDDRQVAMIVDVRIAHAAAEQVRRVIEQRAVAVRRRLQLLQQVRRTAARDTR